MDLSGTESVLIIKPSSLGDVVQTLPALGVLKGQFPELKVRWVVNTEWAPLLEGHPHLVGVVRFPRGECRGVRGWSRSAGWARGLRSLQPDVALDFQGLLRSALMARGSRARRIVGMSDAREGAGMFYHETVRVDRRRHAVDRYLAVAAQVGASLPEGEEPEFILPAGNEPGELERRGLKPGEDYVLLHPFARGRGKSLSVAQVRRFCEALRPRTVVVVGTSGEPDVTQNLCGENICSMVNATELGELIWLMRHAGFTVSVDSGPMHLASALTGRLLGIHTWTDPRRVGPYNPRSWIWKGGQILRVDELAESGRDLEESRETREFTVKDAHIEAMAAFVAEQDASGQTRG